jgi:hypothetical protein
MIVVVPCLVLVLITAIDTTGGFLLMAQQVDKRAQAELDAISRHVADFFKHKKLIVRTLALHQQAIGRFPDDRTQGFLCALVEKPKGDLKEDPRSRHDVNPIYIAFEDRDPRGKPVVQLAKPGEPCPPSDILYDLGVTRRPLSRNR